MISTLGSGGVLLEGTPENTWFEKAILSFNDPPP